MTNIITVIEYLEGTRGGLLDREEHVTSAFATLQQAYAVAVGIRAPPTTSVPLIVQDMIRLLD